VTEQTTTNSSDQVVKTKTKTGLTKPSQLIRREDSVGLRPVSQYDQILRSHQQCSDHTRGEATFR